MKRFYFTVLTLFCSLGVFAQSEIIPPELGSPNLNPRKKKPQSTQNQPNFGADQVENHFKSPDVIPPAPDVASLGKFGDIPVGLYSGIVPLDIPLYTVKSKDINVPIGISVHTGGISVQEIAAWTGLSTALQAGGLITRTVIGRADDKIGGYLNQYLYAPNTLDSLNNAVPNAAYATRNPSPNNPIRNKWTVFDDQVKYSDAQPDNYSYHFAGRSGKFVIDQKNPAVGIPIPYVPLKISITYNNPVPPNPAARDDLSEQTSPFFGTMISFTIMDENGIEYYFSETESTTSKHLDPRQKTRFQYFYSTWHLSRITSPAGGAVRFTYDTYNQYSRQWISEDRRVRDVDACPVVIGADGLPEEINFIQRTQSQTRISGKHLREIAWENGKVTLSPQTANRQDVASPALSTISVFDAHDVLRKKYALYYSYFTEFQDTEYDFFNGTDIYAQPNLGRLRLDSLQEITSNTVCLPPYRFGYEVGSLPHRYSTQMDHWGYFNGANTNTSHYPKAQYGNRIVGDADRHANDVFAKIGTMNTLQYPTGGKTQLVYEGHDSYTPDWDLGLGFKELPAFVYNTSTPITYTTPNYYIGHVNQRQFLSYTNSTVATGGKLYKMGGFSNVDNIALVRLYFYQGSTLIKSIPIESDEEFFLAAGNYQVYLMIAEINSGYVSLSNRISVNVFENNVVNASSTSYNKTVGGIRVKKMTDIPTVGTPVVKEYGYRQENDNTKSSGRLIQTPVYAYTKSEDRISYVYSNGSWIPDQVFSCSDVLMNASSVAPMIQTKGAYVGYDFVEVKHQLNAENGKSTHRFTSPLLYQDLTDDVYPYVPNTDFDWKRGFETQTKQFKKRADNTFFLSQVSTHFPNVDSVYRNVLAVLPACNYFGVRFSASNTYTLGCFYPTFKAYPIVSGWLTKRKTVDTLYNSTEEANAFTVTSTEYTYKGSENIQVASITQTSSATGEMRATTMRYPHDKKATGNVYEAMVDAHIFSPVVEETVWQNNLQIHKKTTNYLRWKNARTQAINGVSINLPAFYAPQTQYWQQTSNDPNELQNTFLSYDDFGNLTSFQGRDGIRTNMDWYWYDGSSRPIAEKGKTHLLKRMTVGAGLSTAQTTQYDYVSGVGMSQVQAPTGSTTTYGYDPLSRLSSITDAQNFELKHFDYHYGGCGATTGLGLTESLNYVLARTARTEQAALNTNPDSTQTQITYLDSLGRTLQTVAYQATPDKSKDVLQQTFQYDASGRVNLALLSTPASNNQGKYEGSALGLASAFYGDANPYNETIFEPSPLNRPLKNFGAGAAWRTNNKFVEHYYRVQGNEILRFVVNSDGSFSTAGSYEAASLLSKWTISERGFNTLEFSDKLGRGGAKAQQLVDINYLITNYVYDDLDRLRVVIPPEAYQKMGVGAGKIRSFTENDEIFKELCFGYRYDTKGKLIEKHIPGAGWEYLCYDKQDRQVMHADDSDKAKDYWHFQKFDALGRKIQSGIKTEIGIVNRAALQTAFDGVTTETYEEITSTGGLYNYTNRSFPNGYEVGEAGVKEVIYYDDYAKWQTDTNYNFKPVTPFDVQANAKGMITGKLFRNLKTNAWQKMVMYYDYQGRVIQNFHLSNKGNIIRKDYQYRFNGELLKISIEKKNSANVVLSTKIMAYEYDHLGRKISYVYTGKPIVKYAYDAIGRLQTKRFSPSGTLQGSKQTGNWTDTNSWLSGILPTLSDNVTINTGQTLTIPAGEKAFAGTMNDQGILKNFGTLNLGKVTTADLYTQSLSYHIRGGLTGINLDAAGNLTNNLFSYKLAYEEGTGGYFDGNIRNQYWKSNIDGKQRAFEYTYDGSSRLKSASYASIPAGENYSLNHVDYDLNGNIKTLSRNGATNTNYTAFGNVDNLTYTYQSNSNKLTKIVDETTTNANLGDFRDGINTDDDYEYWADGSLKKDKNKKIASITYNYLKLPEIITFDDTKTITTEYDAEGTKLKKVVSGGETTDYEEDEIYVNGILYQTSHDEGRIVNGVYEYNITDQNNDLRVAFKDSLGIAVPTQSIFYDPWGLSMKGMQITRNPLNFNKYQFLNRETQLETGYIDLIHRQFDPQTGRFTSQDPVIEGQEHLSLYQYGWNNPVLKFDPDGLEPCCGGITDFVMGFTHAFNQDVSPIPGTNLVRPDGGRNYSNGAGLGHRAALIVGVLEVGAGIGGDAAAVVGEAVSFGAATPAAIPLAIGSTGLILHGGSTISKSLDNMKSEKSHGNKLDDKPAEGYTLRDKRTREVKKYGETTRGEDKFGEGKQKRYSKKELDEKGVDYKKETDGTKKQMHKWQNEKIKDHKENNNGKRPDLNKSDY